MGVLMNGSLNVSKLPKDKLQRAKNGDLYYNFTMRIEDETGKFGNNAGMWDQQTKEERDAKTERHYTGNAKVVWTDGKVAVAVKQEQESNDLPF